MKTLPSYLLLVLVTACSVSDDDTDEVVNQTSQDIIVGCGNQPPCDCALKGTPQCADGDGDGIPAMGDNCVSTYNPNQANCDGDGSGDACDGDNSLVVSQNVGVQVLREFDGNPYCVPTATPHVFLRVRPFLRETQYTTHLQVQFCGPSGNGYENRDLVSTEITVISTTVIGHC